jgi:tRNA-dihydrouridine synthase
MTRAERAKRDDRIVRERMLGATWASIAPGAGVSDRHCRRIYKQWRECPPSLRSARTLELADAELAARQAAIQAAALQTQTATGDTATGQAIGAKVNALDRKIELLLELGLLPRLS